MTQANMEQEMLSQPVRSLQYMLRQLAQRYGTLPELACDGLFGERTLEAVMVFQREFFPPVTGIVNWSTWNAIWEQWQETQVHLEEPRPTRIFPGEGTKVWPGERQEFMSVPQSMFQVLAHSLNGIVPDTADGAHTQASVANVRWLQRAAGLEESGTMDSLTWNALSRLYEVIAVKSTTPQQPSLTGGWG